MTFKVPSVPLHVDLSDQIRLRTIVRIFDESASSTMIDVKFNIGSSSLLGYVISSCFTLCKSYKLIDKHALDVMRHNILCKLIAVRCPWTLC